MLGNIGFPELILVLVIALVVFGPGKLPEVGKSLGKSIGEFKSALKRTEDAIKIEVSEEEEKNKDK